MSYKFLRYSALSSLPIPLGLHIFLYVLLKFKGNKIYLKLRIYIFISAHFGGEFITLVFPNKFAKGYFILCIILISIGNLYKQQFITRYMYCHKMMARSHI
ncbi:hypothetical protein H311_02674 [Anncaliia algerae PRA109]|nr:hypothetical protein H311_02674 [Anncaliia algerae PRA109]